MGELPVGMFKTKLGKEIQTRIINEKIQRECERLIGWVVKSKEKIKDNDCNIKPNEEYEVVDCIEGIIVLCDVKATKYYVGIDYVRKNFEMICFMY